MANHFDFYSSLNLSQSDSPTELHNAIQSRLGVLQSQGAPVDSAEVQQLLVADQILGHPENRVRYDARLEDPSAPPMGVTELRALGSTGRFPDEGAPNSFAPTSARPEKQDAPAALEEGSTSVMPAASPSTPAAPATPSAPDAQSSPSIPTPRQEPTFPPAPSSYSTPSAPPAAPKAPESGAQPPFGQGSRGFAPQGTPAPRPSSDSKAPQPPQSPYTAPPAGPATPAETSAPKQLPGPLAPLTSAPVTAKALVFTLLGTGVVGILGLLGSLFTAVNALASTNSSDAQNIDMIFGEGFGDLILYMSWMLITPAAVLFAVITLASVGAADRVLRVPGSLSPISVTATGAVITVLSLTAAILSVGIMLTIATVLTTIAGVAIIVLAWLPATAPWFTRTA